MYFPPPFRDPFILFGKKVLLIDTKQATRYARADVLRGRGITVDSASSLRQARSLWKAREYDLVLLNVRAEFPGEVLEFYEQIKAWSPDQAFAFLVGPPLYVTKTPPYEAAPEVALASQRAEKVKWVAKAA